MTCQRTRCKLHFFKRRFTCNVCERTLVCLNAHAPCVFLEPCLVPVEVRRGERYKPWYRCLELDLCSWYDQWVLLTIEPQSSKSYIFFFLRPIHSKPPSYVHLSGLQSNSDRQLHCTQYWSSTDADSHSLSTACCVLRPTAITGMLPRRVSLHGNQCDLWCCANNLMSLSFSSSANQEKHLCPFYHDKITK